MKEAVKIILIFIIMIWIVELLNLIKGNSLYSYGILPRHLSGLKGIIFHPFIHTSLQHIIANTIPLFILGLFIAMQGSWFFIKVTSFIIISGGSLLWLLGRSSYHTGASLLIFGYFGFIITQAIYKKTFFSIIIALITVLLYGGIIYSLFPINNHISWEGHLFGLIAGVAGTGILNRKFTLLQADH